MEDGAEVLSDDLVVVLLDDKDRSPEKGVEVRDLVEEEEDLVEGARVHRLLDDLDLRHDVLDHLEDIRHVVQGTVLHVDLLLGAVVILVHLLLGRLLRVKA